MAQKDALSTYQAFLDQMGEALIACDADGFLRHIFLPHIVKTETEVIQIADAATARRHFNGFSSALRAQGADAYTRTATEAWYDGADVLKGRHDTYVMSGGTLVVPKFSNEMTFERRSGRWGLVETRHHANFVSWPDLLPRQAMAAPDDDALYILQDLLDTTSKLVIAGDTSAYCRHVVMPFVFRTARGETVIETEDDLAADIEQINVWLKSQGVSDYVRLARKARFLDADTIEGFYVTYALRGAISVLEPYSNRMILKRGGSGAWRAAFAEHELADALYPGHNARAAHGFFAEEWADRIHPMTDAMIPYQSFLDGNCAHVDAGDFDAWIAGFTLPHHVHYNAVDHHITDPEEVRSFFDTLRQTMQACGARHLVRTAKFAVFLSPDRIFGYHETTARSELGEIRFGPIQSRMILTLDEGQWKCSSVTNSLSNTGFPGGQFQPTDSLPTLREINERMRQ